MTIVIKTDECTPCSPDVFKINDIDAEIEDFGSMKDKRHDIAGPYSCECMCFTPNNDKEAMRKAMEKYSITRGEFKLIQNKLEFAMYVGFCEQCV